MNTLFIGIIQTTTVIITIVILSVRVERRITRIETDVSWLKHILEKLCNKGE